MFKVLGLKSIGRNKLSKIERLEREIEDEARAKARYKGLLETYKADRARQKESEIYFSKDKKYVKIECKKSNSMNLNNPRGEQQMKRENTNGNVITRKFPTLYTLTITK